MCQERITLEWEIRGIIKKNALLRVYTVPNLG
jgi:hypothetical protein